eukprot:8000404-Lingulodinium_polyedra.AAC.1
MPACVSAAQQGNCRASKHNLEPSRAARTPLLWCTARRSLLPCLSNVRHLKPSHVTLLLSLVHSPRDLIRHVACGSAGMVVPFILHMLVGAS